MVKRLIVALLVSGFVAVSATAAQETPNPPKTQPPVVQTPATGGKPQVDESAAQQADGEAKPAQEEPAAKPARIPSEKLLPASTKMWVSVPDADDLEAKFDSTQFGLLAKDPSIKPFAESFQNQAKEWLNNQNVRLGIDFDDLHGVHSGELCLAGVLAEAEGQPVAGSHGLVLLIDVSSTEKEARELQKKIDALLKERGATQESLPINGVLVTKSTVVNPKRFRRSQSNFQAIVNGWLLVSDNEIIFREVLRRINSPATIQPAETLSAQVAFQEVRQQTAIKGVKSQINWFVDPFGYAQLMYAIQDEDRPDRAVRDDWVSKLKDQGFGIFRGIGGAISVATGEHEVLHRTFTYAPRDNRVVNGDRTFKLFEFPTGKPDLLLPPGFVTKDCSGFAIGNWDFEAGLDSVGDIVDGISKEPGGFKRMLNDFKVDPDMRLDVPKLLSLIGKQFVVSSLVARPISDDSEQITIAFPVIAEPAFVLDSIQRASRGKVVNIGGFKVVKLDSSTRSGGNDELDGELDIWDVPDEEALAVPQEPEFELFETAYITVANGYLMITNNKDNLKRLLVQTKSDLAAEQDYLQVTGALQKLIDGKKVCWQQFGRMDRTLEANYEMLRRGEMGKAKTMLARLINKAFAEQAAKRAEANGKEGEEAERQQKLDGSKLPENFQESIAPYLGPTGWAMEVEENGWRITGCMLSRKDVAVVNQESTPETAVEDR